jgi:hypothetical protein
MSLDCRCGLGRVGGCAWPVLATQRSQTSFGAPGEQAEGRGDPLDRVADVHAARTASARIR